MGKKRSLKNPKPPAAAAPYDPPGWPPVLLLSRRDFAEIIVYARRAALSLPEFMMDACRQVNSANLAKAFVAATPSPPPHSPAAGSSSPAPPDCPQEHEEPF